MYSKGFHFFADVRDPGDGLWWRYDALSEGGEAARTTAPSGTTTHTTGGATRQYFPVLLVYVRTPASGNSGGSASEDDAS